MPSFPYQVTMTNGDPTVLQGDGDPTTPEGQLILAPIPVLNLTAGCTVTVGTFTDDGTPRSQDSAYDVVLSVSDLDPETDLPPGILV